MKESGVHNKEQLKRALALEKELYLPKGWNKQKLLKFLTNDISFHLYRYVSYLRKAEYHHSQRGLYHKLLYVFYLRRKNTLGIKLGLDIRLNTFDEGLLIYHAGNIVVNGLARIGKNCKLHGSNCIGNNGKTGDVPTIGSNVRLGVGAKVIGGVYLADNITVAAGAVVIHSCDIKGATLAGVPARVVKVPSDPI